MEDLGLLVGRAQAGDREAYGEIVHRFQDMAYGYAFSILGDSHLAQDAAQEAFVQAYRDLSMLRKPAAFPGWFRRIVFKHCDRIRRRQPAAVPLEALAACVASHECGPAEAAERQELRESVVAAILALPQHQRTVTTLFYINGYNVKDIADFLETPVGTIKRRLHDSRKQMKERITAMVADTIKSSAPKPDEARDAIAFLLGFADRIGRGEPIVQALEALRREAKSHRIRSVIGQLLDSIARRQVLFEVFDKNPGVFPPLVASLVADGERFGILDQTCRLAALWLRDGSFEVPPYLFADAFLFQLRRQIKRGMEDGADALVMDSTRVAPVTEGSEHVAVWIELLMPEGHTVKGEPLFAGPLEALSEFGRFREHTVLDEHQEGDSITGRLRIRLSPEDAEESLLPIAFTPLSDGEEVRISLRAH